MFYMPPQSVKKKGSNGVEYWQSSEGDGAFSGKKLTFDYFMSGTPDSGKFKVVTTLRGKKK